jgi:hypothetical protein
MNLARIAVHPGQGLARKVYEQLLTGLMVQNAAGLGFLSAHRL